MRRPEGGAEGASYCRGRGVRSPLTKIANPPLAVELEDHRISCV